MKEGILVWQGTGQELVLIHGKLKRRNLSVQFGGNTKHDGIRQNWVWENVKRLVLDLFQQVEGDCRIGYQVGTTMVFIETDREWLKCLNYHDEPARVDELTGTFYLSWKMSYRDLVMCG
ncbi:hypothetical protein Tco_1095419, partial [Tanacetum coccineum]